MSNQSLHVSISAEPIFRIFGLEISNSIFTSLIVSFLLIVFAIFFRSKFKNTDKPSSLQNFVEMIVEALYNFVYSITENTKKTLLFFPVISTFFIFIILNNYIGLLPGVGSILTKEAEAQTEITQVASDQEILEAVAEEEEIVESAVHGEPIHAKMVPVFRAATADLNTTLALAIVSVMLTQIFGISHLGFSYFKKFIDFSNPVNFFVGILETVLEFAKIVSFAFRLFGNIFAGEVLLVVMTYLISIAVPAPFYALELFVGFIQALVFSMLSLIFFNLATKSHHEEDHAVAESK
ncbi:F0F1 ATP synthase subunit A [Patescibacteria group bacterium]|nr:F0F1 ATP synthase subunit A [Patescibacteria group bacterium]